MQIGREQSKQSEAAENHVGRHRQRQRTLQRRRLSAGLSGASFDASFAASPGRGSDRFRFCGSDTFCVGWTHSGEVLKNQDAKRASQPARGFIGLSPVSLEQACVLRCVPHSGQHRLAAWDRTYKECLQRAAADQISGRGSGRPSPYRSARRASDFRSSRHRRPSATRCRPRRSSLRKVLLVCTSDNPSASAMCC